MGMSRAVVEDSLLYYLTTENVSTRPDTWEISLHTGDPGVDGDANEVADANYERQGVVFDLHTTPLGEPYVQNTALVVFPAADADYEVTHIAVWDATGEIPLVIQPLQIPKTIAATEQAQVAPGEIKIGEIG